MHRLAEFVLRHRRLVLLFWLITFVVSIAASGKATERLTTDFSLPGQPGYETSKQIMEKYGNGGSVQPYIPVVTVPDGTTVQAQREKIDSVFAQIQAKIPGVRVADFANTGNDVFITADQRTTYALVYGPMMRSMHGAGLDQAITPILDQAAAADGFQWSITGYPMLERGEASSSNAPSVLTETLLGGLGALAVLLFVFASFLALVPLLVAAVSILSTFTVVLGLTYLTDVSFIVQFLVALVGLGIAVDYSLLLVTRWREERDHGHSNHDAVVIAVNTAGRAVTASAGTVAISLLALVMLPVPFLRSMGIGGLLIPLVSMIVVLTLLPALLGGIGPRVDWPKIRRESRASRAWSGWAAMVVRHRWVAAGTAIAILALLIAPVFDLRIGLARTESLASSGPAYSALQTLRTGGVPAGVVSPLEVLVDGAHPAASADEVAQRSTGVQGVSAAFAPSGPAWQHGGAALTDVIPTDETVDSQNAQVVNRVTEAVEGVPGFVGVSGAGASVLDYTKAVYGNFPLVLLVVSIVTFLLLARSFRSLLLPLKAVLLNLVSVAAVFGATVWFWQQGHGSEAIFGIEPTGAITFWLPILVFAFLFGLSMDYEVFILSRMREEYDASGSTKTAVIEGLGRTGRLVTCAALILMLAFLALTATPGTDVKLFATALGIGILLDATVVRALLVPALVALFGKWNWYLPGWAAKALFVRAPDPSPEPGSPPAQKLPASAAMR